MPELIIQQTIQSQWELTYGIKHLKPVNIPLINLHDSRKSTDRSSDEIEIHEIFDATEEEKKMTHDQISQLIPIATPKTKRRLSLLMKKTRKPNF